MDGPEKTPITFRVAEGVELRGDAWGSPERRPIVLLHGGGQTRHSWSGAAEKIASAGWYAVSLDLRGHGESDWSPDGVYGFESFTADTVKVARSFERPPVLVGASLGGVASLLAEGESRESLAAGIVLVDVTPRMEPKGIQRIMDFMTHKPEGFENLEEAADAIAGYREHRSRPKDLSGLAKNLRQGEDGRWRWHWDPAFISGDRSVHEGPSQQSDRLLEAARRLTVPTLLVRGKESDVVSLRGADEFLEAAPGATFADVSGAGHMVAGDRNDVFADAVIEFLLERV
ncbi:alpha/beta hydrolase [Myxococcota bacterium]|nr:alpha/beta hydrolase [Myxococcota bacterium]